MAAAGTEGEKLILCGYFVAAVNELWDEPTSVHLFQAKAVCAGPDHAELGNAICNSL